MSKEHVTLAATSAGGEHKQGSAVAWAQTTAPTTRPDGSTDLAAADLGRIWLDTTNNVLKMLTAVGASDTWTPIGEVLCAIYTAGSEPARGLYIKGNELYFKGPDAAEKCLAGLIDEDNMATNSDTKVPSQQSVKAFVTSGTVTMTNKTLTGATLNTPTANSPVIAGTVSGDAFLDEDDMASNSATKLASQQSIKAHVAAQVATKGAFANGDVVFNTYVTAANTWQDLDLSAKVGANVAMVYLEVTGSPSLYVAVKPKGYGSTTFADHYSSAPLGASMTGVGGKHGYLVCMTDASGVVQIGANSGANAAFAFTIKLIGYVK